MHSHDQLSDISFAEFLFFLSLSLTFPDIHSLLTLDFTTFYPHYLFFFVFSVLMLTNPEPLKPKVQSRRKAETWTSMDPRKPTGEILSVCLLEGLPLSRWFIAEGLTNCVGRDGSPSQMVVLLMASSHTSASVEVLRWLLCPAGGRETRSGSKGQRGRGVEGMLAHRRATVSLQEQHADTCI